MEKLFPAMALPSHSLKGVKSCCFLLVDSYSNQCGLLKLNTKSVLIYTAFWCIYVKVGCSCAICLFSLQ